MEENEQKSTNALISNLNYKWQTLTDHLDLALSQFVDISNCQSVCLALGPYRNLTTLTAATLFLHPNCQVLNHAGGRVYQHKQVDFLSHYSVQRFNRFIQYAIRISTKGKRGRYGGSITLSHAFDAKNPLKEVYSNASTGLLKDNIKCLFWKESLRTSNVIRERNVDLSTIFENDKRLRFLLPIRNPMDCALSNLRTEHGQVFKNIKDRTSEIELAKAVLDEILWFANLQEKYPGRFFYFFEHEISRKMLFNLAEFLSIEPNEIWLDNALTAMKVHGGYPHSLALIDFYRQYVTENFEHLPSLSQGLLFFLTFEDKLAPKPTA